MNSLFLFIVVVYKWYVVVYNLSQNRGGEFLPAVVPGLVIPAKEGRVAHLPPFTNHLLQHE